MEGNQLMSPQTRSLIAASLFALVALGIFAAAYFWPQLFGIQPRDDVPQRELTIKEKMDVLEEVNASAHGEGAQPDTSEEQAAKMEVLEQVSASSQSSGQAQQGGADESGLTEKEKMDILNSLNNP